MKKISFCVWIMLLPTIIFSSKLMNNEKKYTNEEIDNAWIRVPWTSGGYYYHNTLTRDDQDHHPECLSKTCKWNWK